MHTSLLTRTLIVASVLFNAAIADADMPRWKLKEGQKYEVKFMRNMKTQVDSEDVARKFSIAFQLTFEWEVKEAKEDQFIIEETVKRLQAKFSPPTGEAVEVDTDEPRAQWRVGSKSLGLKSIVGERLSIEMDARGRVAKHQPSTKMKIGKEWEKGAKGRKFWPGKDGSYWFRDELGNVSKIGKNADDLQWGHMTGFENRRILAAAEELGWSQKQLDNWVNSDGWKHIAPEAAPHNWSHKGELPGTGNLKEILNSMRKYAESLPN